MKYIYLLLVSLLVVSCGKKQDENAVKKPKPLMSLVQSHSATRNVNPTFLKDVKDWKELKAIDSFFVKFRKISPDEALSNAIELKDLIKSLKDSVKPSSFNMPSLNARVNILYNEVLRLADLTEIGAITAEEVNTQVDKTMSAFSDVNTKVNTILAKKRFENEIDIDVKFIGLDTTKIDSVSKKTINLRLKEQQINRNNLDKGANKRQ
ncbi:hypothetical protein SHK09_03080 [Polaribacter sp. PL03]|uniref:hypothetical protein n=1 Tax=Polaribacter sp. PL03 TaxID=3088353 RepID=UPI0029CE4DB8|nr:hypothetical protein [Polaribacter sp. PL03]MDX6745766.1 hypothetical protein [Polaribacter sp. PL03]